MMTQDNQTPVQEIDEIREALASASVVEALHKVMMQKRPKSPTHKMPATWVTYTGPEVTGFSAYIHWGYDTVTLASISGLTGATQTGRRPIIMEALERLYPTGVVVENTINEALADFLVHRGYTEYSPELHPGSYKKVIEYQMGLATGKTELLLPNRWTSYEVTDLYWLLSTFDNERKHKGTDEGYPGTIQRLSRIRRHYVLSQGPCGTPKPNIHQTVIDLPRDRDDTSPPALLYRILTEVPMNHGLYHEAKKEALAKVRWARDLCVLRRKFC